MGCASGGSARHSRREAQRTPVGEGAGAGREAGAHHDVETAEKLNSFVDCGLDVRLLPDISLKRSGLDIRGAFLDERERLLGGGEVDVDKEDVGALLSEEERRLEADATRD